MAPPGQIATRKIPSLNSGGKFEKKAIKKAIIGNNIIWQNNPTISAFGLLKMIAKFLKFCVKPRLNMINAIIRGSRYVEINCSTKFLNLL